MNPAVLYSFPKPGKKMGRSFDHIDRRPGLMDVMEREWYQLVVLVMNHVAGNGKTGIRKE